MAPSYTSCAILKMGRVRGDVSYVKGRKEEEGRNVHRIRRGVGRLVRKSVLPNFFFFLAKFQLRPNLFFFSFFFLQPHYLPKMERRAPHCYLIIKLSEGPDHMIRLSAPCLVWSGTKRETQRITGWWSRIWVCAARSSFFSFFSAFDATEFAIPGPLRDHEENRPFTYLPTFHLPKLPSCPLTIVALPGARSRFPSLKRKGETP